MMGSRHTPVRQDFFQPMIIVFSTWRETCGSGAGIVMPTIIMRIRSTVIHADPKVGQAGFCGGEAGMAAQFIAGYPTGMKCCPSLGRILSALGAYFRQFPHKNYGFLEYLSDKANPSVC